MPIAHCLVKDFVILPHEWDDVVTDLAEKAKLNKTDITLNVIANTHQFGNHYKIMVNLYLPTLWTSMDVELIQTSLLQAFIENLKLNPSEIFILTSLIESGHVVENGKIVWW